MLDDSNNAPVNCNSGPQLPWLQRDTQPVPTRRDLFLNVNQMLQTLEMKKWVYSKQVNCY